MRPIPARFWLPLLSFALAFIRNEPVCAAAKNPPKIRIAQDGRTFVTETGQQFVPFGVTYYRPGTGWAPQVWKQFDAEATRADFARMKELGINCVRVFISYGSFFMEPHTLSPEGALKFDQFLDIAEEAGIYVHPTGPDHWEGLPEWARADRIADEEALRSLESFWTLFASRYRGRNVIFAYDLRNEPEVAWDNPVMRAKWNRWIEQQYGSAEALTRAWGATNLDLRLGQVPVPDGKDKPRDQHLLDYQHFREGVADEWTRRQVSAIKAADPDALVTVGMIQWSVPSLLPGIRHYAAFKPSRQASFLDFLEIHFYPFSQGFYEYAGAEDETRNLAYLESVVREAALPGKPVIVAEFAWYGGGKLTLDQGKHPAATEEQQARWCRKLVETTDHLAVGWLNWGFYDHPQAGDVSQLTGLLTAGGRLKAWGQEFKRLSIAHSPGAVGSARRLDRPVLDWDLCITSLQSERQFREGYFQAFRQRQP